MLSSTWASRAESVRPSIWIVHCLYFRKGHAATRAAPFEANNNLRAYCLTLLYTLRVLSFVLFSYLLFQWHTCVGVKRSTFLFPMSIFFKYLHISLLFVSVKCTTCTSAFCIWSLHIATLIYGALRCHISSWFNKYLSDGNKLYYFGFFFRKMSHACSILLFSNVSSLSKATVAHRYFHIFYNDSLPTSLATYSIVAPIELGLVCSFALKIVVAFPPYGLWQILERNYYILCYFTTGVFYILRFRLHPFLSTTIVKGNPLQKMLLLE